MVLFITDFICDVICDSRWPDIFHGANFIFVDSVSTNAPLAACIAAISKGICGNVDISFAGNLLSIRFGKFVFRPKTTWAGLKNFLIAHESVVS